LISPLLDVGRLDPLRQHVFRESQHTERQWIERRQGEIVGRTLPFVRVVGEVIDKGLAQDGQQEPLMRRQIMVDLQIDEDL
jgi:hypothetical protein